MRFWSLAARCNLDVPEYYWEGVTRYVKRCMGRNGGMGYGGPGGGSDAHPRVANASMAFILAPPARQDAAHLGRLIGFLATHTGNVRENHGVCVIPFFTTCSALYNADPSA